MLARTREILRGTECWTTRTEARAENGAPVSPVEPSAVRFSLVGALIRAAWNDIQDERWPARAWAVQRLQAVTGHSSLEDWNDARLRVFTDILQALESAAQQQLPLLEPTATQLAASLRERWRGCGCSRASPARRPTTGWWRRRCAWARSWRASPKGKAGENSPLCAEAHLDERNTSD